MSILPPNSSQVRLLNALRQVAGQYAPERIIPPQIGVTDLASLLAAEGVLILYGDIDPALYAQSGVLFNAWAEAVLMLYTRLSESLFPSFTRASAFYADSEWPPLIGIHGLAAPVSAVMAAYMVPFAAARAGTEPARIELLGLMDLMLEALEAHDLPSADTRALRAEGAEVLRQIVQQPVRPLPLAWPASGLADLTRPPSAPNTTAKLAPSVPTPPPIETVSDVPSVLNAPPSLPANSPPARFVPVQTVESAPGARPTAKPRPPVPTPPPDLPDTDAPDHERKRR